MEEVEPQLKWKRIVSGTGSLAGSELLNHYMREFIAKRAGEMLQKYATAWDTTPDGFIDLLMTGSSGFEFKKRKFEYDPDNVLHRSKTMLLRLPRGGGRRLPADNPAFQYDSAEFSYSELCSVFDAYCAELVIPIDQQLDQISDTGTQAHEKPTIIFAGGGSRIPYLDGKMREHFGNRGYHVVFAEEAE